MYTNDNPNLSWSQFEMCNDDKRRYFEMMCRELFKNEFVSEGVTLHSNHNNPGIEVEPVPSRYSKENELCRISFQAKYYDNKVDYSNIKESMEIAKKHYSGKIDKIYLFCNKTISNNNQKYHDIENTLRAANIELCLITNEGVFDLLHKHSDVAKYFFLNRNRGDVVPVTRHKYKIAMSCPDEYRRIAVGVINHLYSYFDRNEILYYSDRETELLENKSGIELQNIYNYESDLFLVFFGNMYMTKSWRCTEHTAIRTKINSDPANRKRVIYIKCDDGCIPGVDESLDGFVDARNKSADEIARYVVERYESIKPKNQEIKYSIIVYDDMQEQLDMLHQELFAVFKNEIRYSVDIVCVNKLTDLYQFNSNQDFDVYILDAAQRSDPYSLQNNHIVQQYNDNMYSVLINNKPNQGIESHFFILSRLPGETVMNEYINAIQNDSVDFIQKKTNSNAAVAKRIKEYLDRNYISHYSTVK